MPKYRMHTGDYLIVDFESSIPNTIRGSEDLADWGNYLLWHWKERLSLVLPPHIQIVGSGGAAIEEIMEDEKIAPSWTGVNLDLLSEYESD